MSSTIDKNEGRVVVVDDDPMVATSLSGVLDLAGYHVDTFTSPQSAVEFLRTHPVDLIMSDVNMPGMSGLEMVARLREQCNDAPVVFLTGAPKVEDSMQAMELGAFRYLAKPLDTKQVNLVVRDAVKWGRLTRASHHGPSGQEREALETSFMRTVSTIQMAYQPIVAAASLQVYGYEALMRSQDPSLRSPLDVLDAAERLGHLHLLGRRLRDIVGEQAATLRPISQSFFVNLHSSDLADPTLYDPTSPLSAFATWVILEITERASLEGIGEVEKRIRALREMGYRIAVDDLGAGYAGLSYFARISPDVVKVDMSLIRGIDADPVKRRVVGSMCTLARELDMLVVAEGIETAAELDAVRELGADFIQGYFIARPAPYPTRAA